LKILSTFQLARRYIKYIQHHFFLLTIATAVVHNKVLYTHSRHTYYKYIYRHIQRKIERERSTRHALRKKRYKVYGNVYIGGTVHYRFRRYSRMKTSSVAAQSLGDGGDRFRIIYIMVREKDTCVSYVYVRYDDVQTGGC